MCECMLERVCVCVCVCVLADVDIYRVIHNFWNNMIGHKSRKNMIEL